MRTPTRDADRIKALIEQARQGSADALGCLIDECRNYLLSVANRALPGTLRAKVGGSDLVQDTALEASRDFSAFQGERLDELLAWLTRILVNNVANVSRYYEETEKRKVSRELPLDPGDVAQASLCNQQPSPSSIAAAQEQQRAIEVCLELLPPDMKTVILLRNREDLSFVEIGIQMQRSTEAVRKLWARAIERLQQELRKADQQM